MKVLILTEGGSKFGFGHVTRCLAIYQAFLEKGIAPKFIVNGDETVTTYFDKIDYEIFDWVKDEERLLKLIELSDIVIIDTLLADLNLFNKISLQATIPVFIDDFRKLNYSGGVVIDWTIFAEERYAISDKVHYLLGSQYVAMRRAFWEVPQKLIKDNITKILITMGGSDKRNLTPQILEELKDVKVIKYILVGKGFANDSKILNIAEMDNNIKLIYYPSDEEIVKLFCKVDIVISASGQTLYELARIGTPTISISVIDNQKYDVEGWQKAEFIEYAGSWEEENVLINMKNCLIKLTNDVILRKTKSMIGQSFVDGQGAIRIVESLIKML